MEKQFISNQFGVPLPETCIALAWEFEANFYWFQNNKNWSLCVKDKFGEYVYVTSERVLTEEDLYPTIPYPAPQIHELLKRCEFEIELNHLDKEDNLSDKIAKEFILNKVKNNGK